MKGLIAKTSRHDRSNKSRNFRDIDVSLHRCGCEVMQNHRRRVDVASDFYRVDGFLRLAGTIKAKVIRDRIRDPWNLHRARFPAFAYQPFLAGRGGNAYLSP